MSTSVWRASEELSTFNYFDNNNLEIAAHSVQKADYGIKEQPVRIPPDVMFFFRIKSKVYTTPSTAGYGAIY